MNLDSFRRVHVILISYAKDSSPPAISEAGMPTSVWYGGNSRDRVIFGRVTAPTSDPPEWKPARHIVAAPSSKSTAPPAPLPIEPPRALPVGPSYPIPVNPLPPGMTGSASLTPNANQVTGKMVSVADGDTLTLLTLTKEQLKVRLEGIDAPEK